MREEGREAVCNKRRRRGYSSYAGEVFKAPANLMNRRFSAQASNGLRITGITEFRLPTGEKVYLSPVIDCFDGMPVAWSIGLPTDAWLVRLSTSAAEGTIAGPAGSRSAVGGHDYVSIE